MSATYLEASAEISACGRYRLLLRRRWEMFDGHVTFVMLNPSTADGAKDDPTIRKCVGFAQRWGFGALEVVNLFAWRAPDPDALIVESSVADIVGPGNDERIDRSTSSASYVIAAWGAHPAALMFGRRDRAVLDRLRASKVDLRCLRTSKSGAPRHPLMLSYDTPRVLFGAP